MSQSKKNSNKKKSNKKSQAPKAAGTVVLKTKQNTNITVSKKQLKTFKKDAKQAPREQLTELLKPNAVNYTSGDWPVVAGKPVDLNWHEVAEACIFAHQAAIPMVTIPVGPAPAKAYLWWYMIHKLRTVGGITPQPDLSVVPSFPDNGALPVGWARFVNNLMPFKDPDTKAVYQFKYDYTGVPSQNSPCLSPSAVYTDFGYGAFGNYSLVPAPEIASVGNSNFPELAWTLDNTAWLFSTLVSTGFDEMSQWWSSAGTYVEARFVSRVAPDASACAVAYNNTCPNPGVVCQSNYFDEEMALILHPAIGLASVNNNLPVGLGLFGVYNTDFIQKDLPSTSTQSPALPVVNVNLAMSGVRELILNYGYITSRTDYSHGTRKTFLKGANMSFPSLRSYCPYYINLNLLAYHQACVEFLKTIFFLPPNQLVNNAVVGSNQYVDPHEYAVARLWLESVIFARTIDFAYPGVILYTAQDFTSNVNYGNDFGTCPMPPVLLDMIETYAPTVKGGRLTIPIFNWLPVASVGLTYNAVVINQVQTRWAQIGTNFVAGAGAGTNINLFDPLNAVPVTTHYTSQLFAFNEYQVGAVGASGLVLRGAGFAQNADWASFVSLVSQNFTAPVPAMPAVGTRMGPAVPCRLASKFVNKAFELFGALANNWVVAEYANMGGYTTQTVVNCRIEPQQSSISTNAAGQTILMVCTVIPTKLGAYYPYDKESCGRCFSYSCRYTPFENDQWPAVQSFSGNSAAVTQLINFTSEGGNSVFMRELQAQRTAHEMTMLEAIRGVIGALHANQVMAFSGLRYTVPVAIMIIMKSKKLLVTAPYHSPGSASLTSYNSPSLWDDFWGLIGDVGERVGRLGGQVVGGLLGGALAMSVPPFNYLAAIPNEQVLVLNSTPKTLKMGQFTKAMLKGNPKYVAPKVETSQQEAKRMSDSVKAADLAFDGFGITVPDPIVPLPKIQFQLMEVSH